MELQKVPTLKLGSEYDLFLQIFYGSTYCMYLGFSLLTINLDYLFIKVCIKVCLLKNIQHHYWSQMAMFNKTQNE